MASASLIHALFGHSTRFSDNRRNGSQGPVGSSSSSCCSSSSLGFSSGLHSCWRNQGLRAQAMTSRGNFASDSGGVASAENKHDHLLVLVHGILARAMEKNDGKWKDHWYKS